VSSSVVTTYISPLTMFRGSRLKSFRLDAIRFGIKWTILYISMFNWAISVIVIVVWLLWVVCIE